MGRLFIRIGTSKGLRGFAAGTGHFMTMGTGLFLVAVGAILRYAVADSWDAVDLEMIGLILMVVGAIAFVVGAIYAFSVGRRRDAVVVERDPRVVERDPRY